MVRGAAAGSVTVGATEMGRVQRSKANVTYLTWYSTGSDVTEIAWKGWGYGTWGDDFGYMGDGV